MTRTFILTLALALSLGAASLAAAESPSQPAVTVAATQTSPAAAPANLTPVPSPDRSKAMSLPGSPLNGAIFADDPECENQCFQDYRDCAAGCSACDQCSCQLALCRAGCGVPYTGC